MNALMSKCTSQLEFILYRECSVLVKLVVGGFKDTFKCHLNWMGLMSENNLKSLRCE